MSVRPLLALLFVLTASPLGGCASRELVRVDHGTMTPALTQPRPSFAFATPLRDAVSPVRFGAGDELGTLLFMPEASATRVSLARAGDETRSTSAAFAPDTIALAIADVEPSRLATLCCHVTDSTGAAWARIALRALRPRWLNSATAALNATVEWMSARSSAGEVNAAALPHVMTDHDARALNTARTAPRAFASLRRSSIVPSPAR